MSDESEEPKIIVDEDWKSKVEREKAEALAKEEADKSAESTSSDSDSEVPPPPPASLSMLVTTLLTQAMAAMGQIPGEEGAAPEVNFPYAKHFIDLVGVIEEKTKGNLTEEESKFISESLHQMRMLYVSASQNPPQKS
ncbi:MAG: DUF1844 domain-containing protein [Aureliella sp.]